MQKLLQDGYFGKNLQQIRKSCKLSQNDVIMKLDLLGRNMSRANYAHIEQGRKNIFISDLILLKQIFNVDYNKFFDNLERK